MHPFNEDETINFGCKINIYTFRQQYIEFYKIYKLNYISLKYVTIKLWSILFKTSLPNNKIVTIT